MKKKLGEVLAGIVLILIGLLIFIFKDPTLSSFHLFLGGAFLAGYFYSGAYGLLIPGCLLLGLTLGSTKTSFFGFSDFNEFTFGLGFIAIYVIDRLYKGKTHWWPLIPGIILVFIGLDNWYGFRNYTWPVILIVFGVWIIIKSFRKKDKK